MAMGSQLYRLGKLPGGYFSTAEAINNKGEVVGYGDTDDGWVHPFYYHWGTMTQLPEPPSSLSAIAVGINNRGEIVGSYLDWDYNVFPIVWKQSRLLPLVP